MLITTQAPQNFTVIVKDAITIFITYNGPLWSIFGGFVMYASTLSGAGFTAWLAALGFGFGMFYGLITLFSVPIAFNWFMKKIFL